MTARTGQSRRLLIAGVLGASLLSPLLATGAAAAEPHRLALQISDDDPAKMRAVLDIAANVSRAYSEKGEEVDIVVVAFNGGIDMLLADRSAVRERMPNFMKSMPNVSFIACGNTLDTLAAKEGSRPPLMPNVSVAQAGVAALLELAERHYTVIRP